MYDHIELPKIQPILARIEQYKALCTHCNKAYISVFSLGYEPGSPFGRSVEIQQVIYIIAMLLVTNDSPNCLEVYFRLRSAKVVFPIFNRLLNRLRKLLGQILYSFPQKISLTRLSNYNKLNHMKLPFSFFHRELLRMSFLHSKDFCC